VFVHEKIYDEFVEKAVNNANSIKLGLPFDPKSEEGPLISQKHMEKVLKYVEYGK
jgi:acyl-CoA reductase-like NAD-dependent aldehyde dehydrogenase